MKVTVLHNQTIFDIAVQHCGTALAAFDIAVLNNRSVTDYFPVGSVLELPNIDYGRTDIANFFRDNDHNPATAWSRENSVIEPIKEGIDYWAIEVDFVVQPDEVELIED